jgi:hypothetical protein
LGVLGDLGCFGCLGALIFLGALALGAFLGAFGLGGECGFCISTLFDPLPNTVIGTGLKLMTIITASARINLFILSVFNL